MEHRANPGPLRAVAARYGLVLVAGWTATILAIFGWNVYWHRQELLEAAASEARGFTKLNFHYRAWNSRVGGLYVAADKVAPNPYLTIPHREVTTRDGATLTMINPAYMTRMVFNSIKADPDLPQPILGRLVSRQPLNPANTADVWEQGVLHKLEAGQVRERWQVTKMDGVPYLRLLSRFVTEESCLKCHAVQGHAPGEVHGGISIAVPLTSYFAMERRTLANSTLGFLLLWCCGTAGITAYSRRRHDQEQLLRAQDVKFRGYIDSSPVGVFIFDDQGNFQEVNRAVCTMTGFLEAELLAMNCFSLLSADSRASACSSFEELVETGLASCSLAYHHRDGTQRWWALDTVRIAPNHYLGFARDITQLKSAEQQLRFQSLVLDQINDAVTVTTLQGIITYVNEAQARQFGCSRDDLLGKSVTCFGDDASLGATQQQIINTTLTEGAWRGEVANRDNQGRWFIMEALTTLLRDETGQVVGMCGVGRDITERKRVEQALQATVAEKDVLLREVHHRVKNNLAAICGLLDLQCLTLEEPGAKKILTELSGRVRSMSLVHEQLYRSESLVNIDCQEYLQTLVRGLCTSYPSSPVTCSVSAEGVNIMLDQAVPCGLIVTELVTNALKYAFPAGYATAAAEPCRIQVSLIREQNIYTLSVADNGAGLPEGFDWAATKTLGLVLVRMLGQHQLGGEWKIDRVGGTRCVLTFTPGIRRSTYD